MQQNLYTRFMGAMNANQFSTTEKEPALRTFRAFCAPFFSFYL